MPNLSTYQRAIYDDVFGGVIIGSAEVIMSKPVPVLSGNEPWDAKHSGWVPQ